MKKKLIDTSEMLHGAIPTQDVIDKLNEVLNKMNQSEGALEEKQIIESFYTELKSWQVVLIQPHESKVWMQTPLDYYEVKRKIGFIERINLLLTKGVIVGSESVERYANILSNTKFPFELNLDPMQTLIAAQNDENKFYFSILSILRRIENVMTEDDFEGLSVYKSPSAIVAMNNAEHYLKEMEKSTKVKSHKIRESLETIPFSDLISKSRIGIPNNFKMSGVNTSKLNKSFEEIIKSATQARA